MRVAIFSVFFSALGSAANAGSTRYHWPSPLVDELEGLLYELHPEPITVSLSQLTNNCTSPFGNESNVADWLRFAYHDMATHNVDDGTGGLDASLYYELDRPENVGSGMRTTQFDFIDFPNKYISKSDVIAIGIIIGLAECNGPIVPFSPGRIDATTAGPPGVPEPQQDLASHTESFRRQGFTPSEMIGLVACGHSIGGVRFPDFPDIVPDTDDGNTVIKTFDTTTQMDNAIVRQYLDGTTQNLLVTHPNKTITSDMRIFSSDKNKTMKRQYRRPQSIFENLWKAVRTSLQGILDAVLPCFGKIELEDATFFQTNDTTTALTRRQGLSPQKYYFSVPINATTSISKFWFEVDEGDHKHPKVLDNGGTGYVIEQDRILYNPRRSHNLFNNNFQVTVAVRNDIVPSRVFANVMYRVTFFPRDNVAEFTRDASQPPVSGYNFYTASMPGPNFMFDLFSVVDGVTYSEDARSTEYIKF